MKVFFKCFTLVLILKSPQSLQASDENIQNNMRFHTYKLTKCYKLKEGVKNKSGKLVFQWYINRKGRAEKIRLIKDQTTIFNKAVINCVKNEILAMAFPPSPQGDPLLVTYPFVFKVKRR